MAPLNSVLIISLLLLAVAKLGVGDPQRMQMDLTPPIRTASHEGGFSYKYANYEFIFYTERMATWTEAVDLCPQLVPGSYLAELSNRKMEKITGYIISKNQHLLQNMTLIWMGGRYGGSSWKWIRHNLPIPCKTAADTYPPWVPQRSFFDNECLAFMKSSAACTFCTIYFVPEECNESHGFLCVRAKKDIPEGENAAEPSEGNGDDENPAEGGGETAEGGEDAVEGEAENVEK